jgi:hypothetical protein
MDSTVVLVVSLFIHPGREIEFRQFETEAAHIMKKYEGKIERVIRPTVSGQRNSAPHEIHIVSFPSMAQFDAYRGDTELARLAPLRQVALARTEVIIGEEGEAYR